MIKLSDTVSNPEVVYFLSRWGKEATQVKYLPFRVDKAMSNGVHGTLITRDNKVSKIPFGELRMMPKAEKKRRAESTMVKAPPPGVLPANLPSDLASWLAQGRAMLEQRENNIGTLKHEKAEAARAVETGDATFAQREAQLKEQLADLQRERALSRTQREERVLELELKIEEAEKEQKAAEQLMQTLGLAK